MSNDIKNRTDSAFYDIIGSNLRELRELRGYTADAMADRLTDLCGCTVSGRSVLSWETGERRISAYMITKSAIVLKCSIETLYAGTDQRGDTDDDLDAKFLREMSIIPRREKEILYELATKWDGDSMALIRLAWVYSRTPKELRRESSGFSIHQFLQAAGDLDDATIADLAYLEQRWCSLYRRK